ncbi:MAG: DNA polymerase III subunit delta' [Desulfuromonas sp.]|nr:DNA polymerase III subunit delta' [Desulfuromonas sp.]
MTFAHIIGHERQKKQLKQAWSSHRLAHAYLFTGTEGIGKRLMAMALTRLIFCDNKTGCGTCNACRRLDHNNHPDLHIIEPDGTQIKIEQIRQLQQDLAHPPTEAARRVCIIDDAEKLNAAASNALLKTLEEPRENTLIILISSHHEQLMDTILSRCQKLPFARLQQSAIAQVLAEHDLDGANSSAGSSDIIAALAAGSLKKALSSDREFYFTQRQKVLKEIAALTAHSVVPMLELAEQLSDNKEQLDSVIWILLSYYRDIFLIVNNAAPTLITNIDMEPQLRIQAKKESPRSIQHKLNSILQCQYQLARNVNKQLATEVLLLRLTTATG